MRALKLMIGWAAILALVVFIISNSQTAEVSLPLSTSITAPTSLIIVASAFLGAIGAAMAKTLFHWAKGKDD